MVWEGNRFRKNQNTGFKALVICEEDDEPYVSRFRVKHVIFDQLLQHDKFVYTPS